MNPTNTFNRYKYNNHSIDINRQTRFNPLDDLNYTRNTSILRLEQHVSNPQCRVPDPKPQINSNKKLTTT